VPDSDLSVDVAVIGAGHNALVAAGYLAKAGLEVAVLEAKPIIGGNTVTEELMLKDWLHDSCSSAHVQIQSNPVLQDDELGLISQYGLRYAYTEPATVLPLDGGDSFVLHRSIPGTADEIARFSSQDAARFLQMMKQWDTIKGAHRRWSAGQPPGTDSVSAAYEALRRQSAWDFIRKNFEHEVTRRVLMWMAFALFQPTGRPGTGPLALSLTAGRLEFGWATAIGGSGALPAALSKQIVDHGGQVLVNSPVSRIITSGGRAVGVETADGRRVTARRAVVSSAHVTTLPGMLGDAVTDDLKEATAAWRPGLPLFAVHAALPEDIRYHAGGELITATAGGLGSPAGTLRQIEGCATGHPETEDPWILLVSSTVADPDRAPGGTLKLLTCAPQTLASGESWDDFGSRYAERLMDIVRQHVEGADKASVLATAHETPVSLAERNIHNIGGSCHGGEFLLSSGEYVPGWQHPTTSVEGLFLTGSTAHPGGSVSGWPGRNAAHAVLSAIGIDPNTVMG
jgi:phytoene dehydrogenase-like protein